MPEVPYGHPEAGFVEFEPLVAVAVELLAAVVASMALLLVLAGWVIGWLISELFGGIHVGPYHPFRSLGGALEGAMASIARPLISRLVALGHMLWAFCMVIWRFVYVVVGTFLGFFEQITGVGQSAQSGLATLKAKEQSDVDTIDRVVAADVNALHTQEQTDFNSLRTAEATDVHNLQTNINAVHDQLQGAEATDVHNLQANINSVSDKLEQQLGQSDTNLQNNINHVHDLLQAQIGQVQANLQGNINSNLATAEAFAQGLVGSGAPAGLIATVTALQSQVSKIATETAECLDPLCDTVTPQAKRLGNLGNLFQELESLGIEALLIALAAECLTDPAAVVNDISTVTHEVGDVVMTGFRDLIGV
jgi:hypothetical protein